MLISSASYGIFVGTFQEGSSMPRRSPFRIDLSADEAAELNRRAAKYTLPYFEVVRAKMILMAAAGMDNDQIAARLDTRREVVSQWRKRFFKERLAGLEERARPGRPRVFPPRADR
jgi:Winged helix-turn helix